MDRIENEPSDFRQYPHVVTADVGRNLRWRLSIGNRLSASGLPRSTPSAPDGAIDAAGRMTDIGRRAMLDALSGTAQRS